MTWSRTAANTTWNSLLAEDAETATFSSTNYTCNRVSMRRVDLEERLADYISEYEFTLAFQYSDFTTAPTRGDLITYNSVVYRVLSTELSPDGADLRCHMGAKYAQRT
jgi:hypothetical protein